MNHEHLSSGDVVVGQYTENGKQAKKGVAADGEEGIEKHREMMQRSAMANGGTLLFPKIGVAKGIKAKPAPAKKKKKAIDDPEPLTPLLTAVEIAKERPPVIAPLATAPITIVKKKIIYLHNKMGRIKLHVEDVLDNDMSFCLVFADEDDVIFIPNAGEVLNFTDVQGDEHQVVYPDSLFNWTDGIKKLMILFKNSETEEEAGIYD